MLTFFSIALVLSILVQIRIKAAPRIIVRMNSDPLLSTLVDLLPPEDEMAWDYWSLWTFKQWETWLLWEATFDGRLTPDMVETRNTTQETV